MLGRSHGLRGERPSRPGEDSSDIAIRGGRLLSSAAGAARDDRMACQLCGKSVAFPCHTRSFARLVRCAYLARRSAHLQARTPSAISCRPDNVSAEENYVVSSQVRTMRCTDGE